MTAGVRVIAEVQHFGRAVALHIAEDDGMGNTHLLGFSGMPIRASVAVWHVLIQNQVMTSPPSPSVTLSITAAQELFDSLWRGGYRPSDKQDPNQAIEAMKDHLADMRSTVTRLLDAQLGPVLSAATLNGPTIAAPRKLPTKADPNA